MQVKHEFAKYIVRIVAALLHIPPCELTFMYLTGEYQNVVGFFVRDKYVINVNTKEAVKLNDLELTAFLIHEMRHAYQYAQVTGLSKPEESKETLKKWKEELETYQTPIINDEKYYHQEIEIDAISYTAFFTEKFLLQKLKVPESIKSEVEKRKSIFCEKYALT